MAMPRRKEYLASGEYYHIFNRSVAKQPIFHSKYDYLRLIKLINFYRFKENNVKFSRFLNLNRQLRAQYLDSLYMTNEKVEILCFALMPNHYHFILKQIEENGISSFIRIIQNSYAKYYNIKNDRSGALFLAPFKSVRIESEEQLIHTSRYIHLNPLTGYLIKESYELEQYPYTSFKDYLSEFPRKFVSTQSIMSLFTNNDAIKSFTYDRISYQRDLKEIEHLMMD